MIGREWVSRTGRKGRKFGGKKNAGSMRSRQKKRKEERLKIG